MTILLMVLILIPILTGMALPVWIRTHSWLSFLRAFAVSLFGIVLPGMAFLLATLYLPEWKGNCQFGWVDCFHRGKLILLPVLLWSLTSLYVVDVLGVSRSVAKNWVRWGLLNGAIVSSVCLVHGIATLSVVLIGMWPCGLIPVYTTIWYTRRAWQFWRGSSPPYAQTGHAILPTLPFWLGSVLYSQRLYSALPDAPPNSCFVVTAASHGHPWFVGSRCVRGADGCLRNINDQLLVFWALESIWQKQAPAFHAILRRIYNVWGYRAAGLIRNRWLADLVYLLLKPAEWLAVAWLKLAGSDVKNGPKQIFTRLKVWKLGGGSKTGLRRVRQGFAVVVAAIAIYFFLVPGVMVVFNLCDPALRVPGISRQAWWLHRTLAPRFTTWARARVASGRAAHLQLLDVPSTEWPMFSSVFYLWATEALQADWEQQNPRWRGTAPAVTARPAIDAAMALILDPVHHTWVQQHWGTNYLHTQNCFFRTLVIAGVTSYTRLTGDRQHLPLLRDQVQSLCAEFDASPKGWLNDYPHECYPIDVVCCLACVQRAATLLDMDVHEFIVRERRGFTGQMLDKYGLPPYVAVCGTGAPLDCSRGTGNSHTLIFSPELWPDLAQTWYAAYEKYFWQDNGWVAGFREYPRAEWRHPEAFFDVDAGPVICGLSPAANAFGLAATRRNGRFDHAYTLGAEGVVVSWPLLDGTMLGCRLLSGLGGTDAPYLGETALLFHLTQNPVAGVAITRGGKLTPMVWIGLAIYFGVGGLMLGRAVQVWRRMRS